MDIANAGLTVATSDYKTFRLVESDGDEPDAICAKLSAFVGRDRSVIPGKTVMELSDKAIYVTLKKAKAAHEQLASATAPEQPAPIDDADEALDRALADDNPEPPKPAGQWRCSRCGKVTTEWPSNGKCVCLGNLQPVDVEAETGPREA